LPDSQLKRHALLALLLVALALAVRAPALVHRSWWIDELVTRDIGRLPFWEFSPVTPTNRFNHSMVGFALHDKGPGPLTYLLEGAFAGRAEPVVGEYWLRIPGIAAGAATVGLLFLLMVSMGISTPAAFIAGAIAAMLPQWVQWSTGARGYAWAVLTALLQVWLAVGVVRGQGRIAIKIAALGLLAPAGFLIHPFHAVFNVGLFVALLAVRPGGAVRKVAMVAAGVVAMQALYLHAWFAALRRTGVDAGGVELSIGNLCTAIAAIISGHWFLALFLVALTGSGFFLLVRSSDKLWQFIGWLCFLCGLACISLATYMAMRYFAADRYFYFATIPALLLLGRALHPVSVRLEPFADRRGFHYAAILAHAVLVGILAKPIMQVAKTPDHDWRAALLWLQKQTASEDVILTGPNSDYEIFSAYAKAIGLKGNYPLTIMNPQGRRLGVHEPEAVRALVNSGRRVWYITPFLGQHRTPEYWQEVKSRFSEVARFPGRADVAVLRSR